MPTGMAAQRTMAYLHHHGYVATLAPSCSAVLHALEAPGCGLRVLLTEANPNPNPNPDPDPNPNPNPNPNPDPNPDPSPGQVLLAEAQPRPQRLGEPPLA